MFGSYDIAIIIFVVVVAVGAGLFFLNKWATKKMGEQQTMIERTKQTASIYVIDKKKMKVAEANLPQSVIKQMPKMYKFIKVYMVKAKVGPQIATLMCEKKVFDAVPVMKTVKVDLAGIYIVHVKGMKTEKELKAIRNAKRAESNKPMDVAYTKITSVFKRKKSR